MEILRKFTEIPPRKNSNAVYLARPNLYIGFHGCDKSVGENNSERALDWAEHHRSIKHPFVIGVVYTLGTCLDLTDKHYIDLLSKEYEKFVYDMTCMGKEIPENQNVTNDQAKDELLRKLDCAVIQHLHYVDDRMQGRMVYDSVCGIWVV